MASEESGLRNSVPAGRMRGLVNELCLMDPVASEGLGWERLPVRVQRPWRARPHPPVTRQRGRGWGEGGLGLLLPH